MKTLHERLTEGVLDTDNTQNQIENYGKHAHDIQAYYYYTDGFQFGWSAGIKDSDWWPIFDMKFVLNYYHKYFDPQIAMLGIEGYHGGNLANMSKKMPRFCKGQSYFELTHCALAYLILSARAGEEFDEKILKDHMSRFLNKENGADKDTEIIVTDITDSTWARKEDWPEGARAYRVVISNPRVFPGGNLRPLYLDFYPKEYLKKNSSKLLK